MAILAEIIFEEEKGISKISLVKRPAIEVNFLKFAKEQELKFSVDSDKMLITGPVLVPNRQYYRGKDYFGGEEAGYVFFTKDTIRKLGQDFLKHANNSINLEHKDDLQSEDMDLVEMWYVENEIDKCYAMGFTKEDCPIGTLFMTQHVNNPEIWQKIKEGEFNGFSIQGYLAKNIIGTGLDLKKEYNEDEIVGIIVGLALAELPPVIQEDNSTHQIDKTFLYNWNDGQEDVIVNSVNGDAVRDNGFDEWVDGGNHYVDINLAPDQQKYAKFIPENEIWVDDLFILKPDDEAAIVLHEMTERTLIKDYKFTYSNDVDGAHEIANGAEVQFRNQAGGQANDALRQSIYQDYITKYGQNKEKFTSSGLSGKTTTHKEAPATGGTVTTSGMTATTGATIGATPTTGSTSGATATTDTTGQTGTTLNMGVNKSVTTSEDNQNIPTTVTSGVRYAKTRRNDGVIVTDNDLMKAMITWNTPEERELAVKKWKAMRDKKESVQLSLVDRIKAQTLNMGAPDNFINSNSYQALNGQKSTGSAQLQRTLNTNSKKKQIVAQAEASKKQRDHDQAQADANLKAVKSKLNAMKNDKSKPTAIQAIDLPAIKNNKK